MSKKIFTASRKSYYKVEELCNMLLEKNDAGNWDDFDQFCLFLEKKEELVLHCGEKMPLYELLFYAWQVASSHSGVSSPAPDLGCLMASLALSSMAYKKVNNILLGGINNISPALLLTDEKDLRFWISTKEVPDSKSANLIEHLTRFVPHTTWRILEEGKEIRESFIYLGTTFKNLSQFPENFFDFSSYMTNGFVLAPTSELSVRRYTFYREKWVNSGLIRSILKMPPASGAWNRTHSTLFDLGQNSSNMIRMAEYSGASPSVGKLKIDQCIELLESRICKPGATDVSLEELAYKGQYNLSPSFYLGAGLQKKAKNGLTLRNKALILRSQAPRSKFDEASAQIESPQVDQSGIWARELSLQECDPLTGFVDESMGRPVQVPFDRNSPDAKYFLQPNDIIFSFRGTEKSVGQTGFIYETDGNSIAGLSMCIIRALPGMNPAWLYYYLRQPEVLAYIRSQAVGGTLVTVNTPILQDLPLVMPSDRELRNILDSHEEICRNSAIISEKRAINRQMIEKMKDNFAELQKD